MTGMITLIARTAPNNREHRLALRPAELDDSEALARLYFSSYEGEVSSQQEAEKKVSAIIKGEHGTFYPEASPVLVDDNNRIVAAALCLRERTDGIKPADLPTIFELFTAASRRREGLAEKLIRQALDVMATDGFDEVTVRVEENNYAALALYLTLDFNRWNPDDDEI